MPGWEMVWRERACLLVMTKGRRAQGRQRMKYMDGIKDITGTERIDNIVELAGNTRVWHPMVANIELTRHYANLRKHYGNHIFI